MNEDGNMDEGGKDKGQVWVWFDTDGTPHASWRSDEWATWMPVDMLGGNVEVAP